MYYFSTINRDEDCLITNYLIVSSGTFLVRNAIERVKLACQDKNTCHTPDFQNPQIADSQRRTECFFSS